MKPFKLVTSVLILLFAFQQTPSAETYLDQIQMLIDEDQLQQALKLADENIAQDDSDIRLLFMKGLILTRMDDLENAEELFVRMTNEHPELPEPFNNLAVIYALKGEFDKAEEALQKAINTHPSYATAHENLGDIYAKMASQAYNQALELDQDNKSAREKLSLVSELFSVKAVPELPGGTTGKEIKPEPVVTGAETTPSELVTAAEDKVKQQVAAVEETEKQQAAVTDTGKKQQDDAAKEEVVMALNAWAGAWSSQDVDSYLASYASDFVPPKKLSRKVWNAQRKKRLQAPKFIKVEVSDINVVFNDNGQVRVRFSQKYQSDTYEDRVKKEILMNKVDGKWLIVKERSR